MTAVRDALVVDCDEQNLELACVLLSDAGMTVRAVNAADLLGPALTERCPDVVLLEMRLPDVDAVELVARLRREPETASLPIIAVTACAMRGDRERFLAAGCDGYIPKPVETRRFADQVRQIVADSRGERG